MKTANKCLIAKESGILQMPYEDYVAIVAKAKEGLRIREVKNEVLASLQGFLGGKIAVAEVSAKIDNARTDIKKEPAAAEKGAVEVKAEAKAEAKPEPKAEARPEPKVEAQPEPKAEAKPADKAKASAPRTASNGMEIPPIKKDISDHFHKCDESGRLFSVFKQYYACLNDACGGTVRVTMKDGFCSLWNYDEWEEFAFVDIFEGQLRVAVNPRYTESLESLNLCEVPRLLSSRHNLICVQVDDLNKTLLEVMVKAFEEVGLTV